MKRLFLFGALVVGAALPLSAHASFTIASFSGGAGSILSQITGGYSISNAVFKDFQSRSGNQAWDPTASDDKITAGNSFLAYNSTNPESANRVCYIIDNALAPGATAATSLGSGGSDGNDNNTGEYNFKYCPVSSASGATCSPTNSGAYPQWVYERAQSSQPNPSGFSSRATSLTCTSSAIPIPWIQAASMSVSPGLTTKLYYYDTTQAREKKAWVQNSCGGYDSEYVSAWASAGGWALSSSSSGIVSYSQAQFDPDLGCSTGLLSWKADYGGPYPTVYSTTPPINVKTTFTYSVSSPNGTGSASATVDVTGTSGGAITCTVTADHTSPYTLASGDTVVVKYTASCTGGTAPYTYTWSGPAFVSSQPGNVATTPGQTYTYYSTQQSYTAYVDVQDSVGGIGNGSMTFVTQPPATSKPDYVANQPGSQQTPALNTALTFQGTVKNSGSVSGGTTSNVEFQIIGPDPSLNATLDTLNYPVPNLAAGATSANVPAPSSYTPTQNGTYTVKLCADTPGNRVAESNETNNCSTSYSFTLGAGSPGGPLSATCSVSPTTGPENSFFSWMAAASGGTPPYTYTWGGSAFSSTCSNPRNPGTTNSSSQSESYHGAGSCEGTYSGNVTVKDSAAPQNTASNISCGSITVDNSAVACSFSPSKTTVKRGEIFSLSWNCGATANYCIAEGCPTDNWNVALSGSQCPTTNGATSGTDDNIRHLQSGTVTYGLTCTKTGTRGSTGTFYTSVNVVYPRVTIAASPARVQAGSTVDLSWAAYDVTNCSVASSTPIIASGNADANNTFIGSALPPPVINAQTTFIISCTDLTGAVKSATTTVNIVPIFCEPGQGC